MLLDTGHRLGPYEILEPLGSGGMGEVYRALDTRLRRDVAIKVLSAQLATDRDALSRFEREARAIAALSHPNIIAIYDVGKTDEVSYVVTELLGGETLRTRLKKGALRPKDATDCALQMARGLAAAHDKGLIHRDLKPENVFLTRDGHIKILDFGLAKASAPPASDAGSENTPTVTSHTQAGVVLGTVGYMSPEQVRGRDADHRSDIFSFGAVLYEVISGQRAFSGSSQADTMSAILTIDPPRLSSTSSTVTALDEIAHRCLSKNATDRYQSTRELETALQAAGELESGSGLGRPAGGEVGATPTSTPTQPLAAVDETLSIAVLPFADMSPAHDQDYFCEGMAEEILSALSQIEGLRVAARTSTFQFKGKTQDIRKIGDALGVSKVLEGSVRTAGKKLRVTAQLVNVADGYRLWSERYDREMEDVFAIQDEIAQNVVNALKLTLVEPDLPTGGQKHTVDIEAYQLFLKGRHHRYKQEFRAALRLYEQAVERDPGYAMARAGVAEICVLLANYGFMRPKIAFARAEEELEHAVALAGDSAETKSVECWYRLAYEWDPEAAFAAGQRAIELNPGHIVSHTFYGLVLGCTGRHERALPLLAKAVELDPLAPYGFGMIAVENLMRRDFEASLDACRKGLELDPQYMLCTWPQAYAYMGLGRLDESIQMFERALAIGDRSSHVLGGLGCAKGRAGRTDETRAVIDELRERSKREYVAPIQLARLHASLGEIDEAVTHFEQSVSQRDPYALFIGVPGLEEIENHPRYLTLLKKMGVRE